MLVRKGEGAPALWPWIQIIDGLVRRLGPDSMRAALGAAALEVARVLPQSSGAHVIPVLPAVNDDSARFRPRNRARYTGSVRAHLLT